MIGVFKHRTIFVPFLSLLTWSIVGTATVINSPVVGDSLFQCAILLFCDLQ
jgi:hypothetical protein